MTDLPLGAAGWTFISLYLSSLILLGWLGRRAMTTKTLEDFYLGGGQFGFWVLLFTLFATQYSGNTFFGFTGKTYRVGYGWVVALHFMTAVVVTYLVIAPHLHRLAKRHRFVTPPDFLVHRFDSRALATIAALVMIFALANYLLAQLMAMGRAMEGLAGGDAPVAYGVGVSVLALIMVVYGTLGGLRAVAWTDAIQGLLLMVGFAALAAVLAEHYGSIGEATRILAARDAETGSTYTTRPDANACRVWLSYVVIVGLGSALYPQAVQRMYAARSLKTLKTSLAVMAFMPLPAILTVLYAGIVAAAYLPGLSGAGSDAALGALLADVKDTGPLAGALVVVLIAAVLAAMMSTADSALLSISSMVTKDLYGGWLRPQASEAELTRVGKVSSWTLLAGLVWLAIALREHTSLVALLDRKFDVLVQLVPAFFGGLHIAWLARGPTIAGLVVGLTVALSLAFGDFAFVDGGKVAGFHPGLVALLPNLAVAVLGSRLVRASARNDATLPG